MVIGEIYSPPTRGLRYFSTCDQISFFKFYDLELKEYCCPLVTEGESIYIYVILSIKIQPKYWPIWTKIEKEME